MNFSSYQRENRIKKLAGIKPMPYGASMTTRHLVMKKDECPFAMVGLPSIFRHLDFHQVQARKWENAPLQSSALELNSSPAF